MSETELTNQERQIVTIGGNNFFVDALTEQQVQQLNTVNDLSKAVSALASAVLVVTNIKNISALAAMGLENFTAQTAEALSQNEKAIVPAQEEAPAVN